MISYWSGMSPAVARWNQSRQQLAVGQIARRPEHDDDMVVWARTDP
jgi:hypothetical protein